METLKTYLEVLNGTTELALATCVENRPNVRIVCYIFDELDPGVLYFATEGISPKVAEGLLNEHVAITTIPRNGVAHIRSNEVVMKKSPFGLDKFKDDFIARIEGYDETIAAIGDSLDVYELRLKRAVIVTGFEEPMILAFSHIN